MPDQSVVIALAVVDEAGVSLEQSWAIYALEDAIEEKLKAELPEAAHDGHVLPIGEAGDAAIFIFGPSAARIAAIVAPLVRVHWPHGHATLTTYENDSFQGGGEQAL